MHFIYSFLSHSFPIKGNGSTNGTIMMTRTTSPIDDNTICLAIVFLPIWYASSCVTIVDGVTTFKAIWVCRLHRCRFSLCIVIDVHSPPVCNSLYINKKRSTKRFPSSTVINGAARCNLSLSCIIGTIGTNLNLCHFHNQIPRT